MRSWYFSYFNIFYRFFCSFLNFNLSEKCRLSFSQIMPFCGVFFGEIFSFCWSEYRYFWNVNCRNRIRCRFFYLYFCKSNGSHNFSGNFERSIGNNPVVMEPFLHFGAFHLLVKLNLITWLLDCLILTNCYPFVFPHALPFFFVPFGFDRSKNTFVQMMYVIC